MGTRSFGVVRPRQDPLRERYRHVPADAWINDGARSVDACSEDPFHGNVVPNNGTGPSLRFGIHRAIGGLHDFPNPGDLLSAALAACFDSTLRMVADHLGIRLESLSVEVTGECDVRGCLQVGPSVPVGFQRMRCSVRLRPGSDVDEHRLRMLLGVAERYCVVLQTLRNGVTVDAQLEEEKSHV
jgi:uncharacterized OsmC-like protein